MPQSEDEANSPVPVVNDMRAEDDMATSSLPETPTVELTVAMKGEEIASQGTESLVDKSCRNIMTQSEEEASSPVSAENDVTAENDMVPGDFARTPAVEVTASMVDEEEALQRTAALDEKEAREKAMEEYRQMEDKQRLKRLHHLLNKSNLYAKFLLDRMEKQLAEEKERQQKACRKVQASETLATGTDEKSAATGVAQERGGQSAPESAYRPGRMSTRRTRSRSGQDERPSMPPASAQKGGMVMCSASPPDSPTQSNPDKSQQPSPSQRPTRTRKRPAHLANDYKLADYLDRGTLAKRAKVSEKDDASSTATVAKDEKAPLERAVTASANITGVDAPEDVSEESVTQQPVLLTGGKLRQYQLDGLQWLKVLFENGVNGILADEMGLGKTIQCISLVAHLIEQGVPGPYLIAAPLSTLPNWVNEFKKFVPEIPFILYHGSQVEREQLRRRMKLTKVTPTISMIPVVITSYEIVMRDRKHLGRRPWKYVIVDEGHRIKNLNCRLIKELKAFHSANRLLLTGTPLQNNLAELWSLLNFLLPDIFDDINSFQSWFDFSDLSDKGGHERIVAKEEEQHVLDMLHKILTPFLLRRVKSDVELSIPPKKETLVYAQLTSAQQDFYKALLALTLQRSMSKRRKSTSAKEDEMDVIDASCIDLEALIRRGRNQCPTLATEAVNLSLCNVHMQLRKCCNHPYLLSYPLNEVGQFRIDEEIVSSSGKMQLLDCLLGYMRRDKRKVLIFSQMTKMLDIIEDYASYRRYPYCRLDGGTSLPDRQDQIEMFNEDDDAFLFLLSTRAGGLGINLTAADIVIIYDSDWNPQADLQAQDRCHRIGQTKPVSVLRLVAAHSIDEQMVERAAAKRKLEKMVIHRGKFKGNHTDETITPQSLLQLLSSRDHDGTVSSGVNNSLSDDDVALLLSHIPADNKDNVASFFKVIPEQETFV